jgi:hypothetical protein
MKTQPTNDTTEFCLAPSGLVDRVQAKIGLVSPTSPRLVTRAVVTALVAWLPLCVMAVIAGPAESTTGVTFFKDIAANVRFLFVIPLLILAEASIGRRTQWVVSEFLESGLVVDDDVPRFHAALGRAKALLDSFWAEVILLAAVYGFIWWVVRDASVDATSFWYQDPVSHRLAPAGWWYALVASPIVMFLFLRWMWRYAVWSWFLQRMARLNLNLAGTHPDRSGGLGFVDIGHTSFAAVSLAASCVISAAAANRIFHEGVSIKSYQSVLIGFVVLAIVVGLAPLATFLKPLIKTKRQGLFKYGRFASRYTQGFERKWLSEGATPDEPMLGSGDIQSLADLGGSFERLDSMRVVAFDRKVVLTFAFAAAAPMLPLLLSVVPLREIVSLLLKAVM